MNSSAKRSILFHSTMGCVKFLHLKQVGRSMYIGLITCVNLDFTRNNRDCFISNRRHQKYCIISLIVDNLILHPRNFHYIVFSIIVNSRSIVFEFWTSKWSDNVNEKPVYIYRINRWYTYSCFTPSEVIVVSSLRWVVLLAYLFAITEYYCGYATYYLYLQTYVAYFTLSL